MAARRRALLHDRAPRGGESARAGVGGPARCRRGGASLSIAGVPGTCCSAGRCVHKHVDVAVASGGCGFLRIQESKRRSASMAPEAYVDDARDPMRRRRRRLDGGRHRAPRPPCPRARRAGVPDRRHPRRLRRQSSTGTRSTTSATTRIAAPSSPRSSASRTSAPRGARGSFGTSSWTRRCRWGSRRLAR